MTHTGRWSSSKPNFRDFTHGTGMEIHSLKTGDRAKPKNTLLRLFSKYIRLNDGTWTTAGTMFQVWRYRLAAAWSAIRVGDFGIETYNAFKHDFYSACYGGLNNFRDGPLGSTFMVPEGRNNARASQ